MCEEGNRQCNTKNVLKTTHRTTNHKNWHIYIIQGKVHISVLCVAKGPSSIATSRIIWRVMLTQILILAHCVEGISYPGTTQRYTVKKILGRILITLLCVAKGLYPEANPKRHIKSLARENLYQCVLRGNIIVDTSKVTMIIPFSHYHNDSHIRPYRLATLKCSHT